MDWKEFTSKTVDEALTNAMLDMGTTADNLEYEIIEKETSGFLGMFSKPARIKVKIKQETIIIVPIVVIFFDFKRICSN